MPRAPLLEPRKQALQARSAQTVQNIVEAAARILEQRGFDAYTTNAIAERAGISIGSLYQYFPNKDAVTVALMRRETEQLAADIAAASQIEDWREALSRMVHVAVVQQLRRPRLAKLLDSEEGRLARQRGELRSVDRLAAQIVKVLERGEIEHGGPARDLAFDLIAITRGMTDMAGERGEADAPALMRRVGRAVLRYIGV